MNNKNVLTDVGPPKKMNINGVNYVYIGNSVDDIITISGNLYLNKERILETMEKYNDD